MDSTGKKLPRSSRMKRLIHLVGSPTRRDPAETDAVEEYTQIVVPTVGSWGSRRQLDLQAALEQLRASGVTSLMVEGGGNVLRSFLEAGLYDSIVVTVAPKIFAKPFCPLCDVVWEGAKQSESLLLRKCIRCPSRRNKQRDVTLMLKRLS
mmetsp:Transcript_15602/g.59277  ORF Transcript_15602/g.59277 Transcript_15602/m.59277 type:complete len:150 (-) Transcript_15602:95-544(-)